MSEPVYVPAHYRRRPAGGAAAQETAMGEPAPPPASPAEPVGGGGFLSARYGPLPAWGWLTLAAGTAVIFIWWRSRKNKTATANATPAQAAPSNVSTLSQTSGECTDAQGNLVPCSQADYASQIASLQAEIDNMQGAASQPTGTAATPAPAAAAAAPATTGQPVAGGSTMQVQVPNLRGMSTSQAMQMLQALGLKVSAAGGGSTVTSSAPASGQTTTVGQTIQLQTQ